MSTHAVAFYPDGTVRVELVGPYRSLERAEAAMERLTVALDHPNDGDDDLYELNTHRVPHVITFMTEAEAIEEYGLDLEPSGSGLCLECGMGCTAPEHSAPEPSDSMNKEGGTGDAESTG